jgi:hypothetical protein
LFFFPKKLFWGGPTKRFKKLGGRANENKDKKFPKNCFGRADEKKGKEKKYVFPTSGSDLSCYGIS